MADQNGSVLRIVHSAPWLLGPYSRNSTSCGISFKLYGFAHLKDRMVAKWDPKITEKACWSGGVSNKNRGSKRKIIYSVQLLRKKHELIRPVAHTGCTEDSELMTMKITAVSLQFLKGCRVNITFAYLKVQ